MVFSSDSNGFQWGTKRGTKTNLAEGENKFGVVISKIFGKNKHSNTDLQEDGQVSDMQEENQKMQEAQESAELEEIELAESEVTDIQSIDRIRDEQRLAAHGVSIGPAPFLNPLECKMRPRSEYGWFPNRRPASSSPSDMVHPVTKARIRGEANAILNGHVSDESALYEADYNMFDTPPSNEHEGCAVKISDNHQLDYVAVMASAYGSKFDEWRGWIECYTKGQFNLNDLPLPPELTAQFQYLQGIHPPNEPERVCRTKHYDIVWEEWSPERGKNVGKLVLEAMKFFGTKTIVLSIFDDKHELIKVEEGLRRNEIDREASIAAHVLYSSEVMVVLDTKKDWRFSQNPLVINKPKTRFYAGAPLLTDGGFALGVLSILAKEPQEEFGVYPRRKLAKFAAKITAELNYIVNCIHDPQRRMTPLLQRESTFICNYSADPALVPSALKYYKSVKSKNNPRLLLQTTVQPRKKSIGELTPPSSAESNFMSFFDKPASFGKNNEQLSEDPVLLDNSALGQETIPGFQCLRISTPRPFSASDITSLHNNPPNTPEQSFNDDYDLAQRNFDLTVESFMSLSDAELYEEQPEEDSHTDGVSSGPVQDEDQPHQTMQSDPSDFAGAGVKTSRRDARSTPAKNASLDPTNSMLVLYTPPAMEQLANRLSTALVKLEKPRTKTRQRRSSSVKSEAAFFCSRVADYLEYDLVYCVELKPARSPMTDSELFASDGLQKRILTAYGLRKSAAHLSNDLHLNALRSRSAFFWNNPEEARYERGEYATGCMIPIHYFEGGPRVRRSSGIVLGAFRFPSRKGEYDGRDATEDLKKLIEYGKDLRHVLLTMYELENPKPKRTYTEPAAPKSYPANEAMEVKLDHGRPHTNQQSFVSTKQPLNAADFVGFPANEATEVTLNMVHARKYSNARHAPPPKQEARRAPY